MRDREATAAWYRDQLGIDVSTEWWGCEFKWSEQAGANEASTTWGLFAADSDYLGDRANQAMVNFRVGDLDAMLAQLKGAGCAVDPRVERSDYGAFGWVTDPDGRRIELWQPPP